MVSPIPVNKRFMNTSLAAKSIRYRLCALRGRTYWPCSSFRILGYSSPTFCRSLDAAPNPESEKVMEGLAVIQAEPHRSLYAARFIDTHRGEMPVPTGTRTPAGELA